MVGKEKEEREKVGSAKKRGKTGTTTIEDQDCERKDEEANLGDWPRRDIVRSYVGLRKKRDHGRKGKLVNPHREAMVQRRSVVGTAIERSGVVCWATMMVFRVSKFGKKGDTFKKCVVSPGAMETDKEKNLKYQVKR